MISLNSERLLLREIRETDLTSGYVEWLNDPDVNQFLETRLSVQSIGSVRQYWREHRESTCDMWWAICERDHQDRHIGNIKVGPIHSAHQRADVSMFIGEKQAWGKGYGSEAIALVIQWARNSNRLRKLSAGIYKENVGSIKAFTRCGFELEGVLRKEVVCADGSRSDVLRYGLLL